MSDQTTPNEVLPPPPPEPRFVAVLHGIERWDGGGHVFTRNTPVTIYRRTREYLEKAAPDLFNFKPYEEN